MSKKCYADVVVYFRVHGLKKLFLSAFVLFNYLLVCFAPVKLNTVHICRFMHIG